MPYHQEVILAMELNRSHIGKLVQIITDSWSMTGTLTRVDQHDNREWEIDYSNGYSLVPSGGEIYTTLQVGPWRGDVIGNQPVTVETVKGTLEAPERARLEQIGRSLDDLETSEWQKLAGVGIIAEDAIEGKVVEDSGEPVVVHYLIRGHAACLTMKPEIFMTGNTANVNCPACLREMANDLPPLPPAPGEWPDLSDLADPDDPHPELPC